MPVVERDVQEKDFKLSSFHEAMLRRGQEILARRREEAMVSKDVPFQELLTLERFNSFKDYVSNVVFQGLADYTDFQKTCLHWNSSEHVAWLELPGFSRIGVKCKRERDTWSLAWFSPLLDPDGFSYAVRHGKASMSFHLTLEEALAVAKEVAERGS